MPLSTITLFSSCVSGFMLCAVSGPVGSADKNEKITYVKLMGIEKSQETVDELTKEAVNALGVFDGDTSFLEKLAYKLALRKK